MPQRAFPAHADDAFRNAKLRWENCHRARGGSKVKSSRNERPGRRYPTLVAEPLPVDFANDVGVVRVYADTPHAERKGFPTA
jgi:hypothetical protein